MESSCFSAASLPRHNLLFVWCQIHSVVIVQPVDIEPVLLPVEIRRHLCHHRRHFALRLALFELLQLLPQRMLLFFRKIRSFHFLQYPFGQRIVLPFTGIRFFLKFPDTPLINPVLYLLYIWLLLVLRQLALSFQLPL